MTETSIEEYVAKAVQGSKEALEEVVRRVQGQVYGLSLRMLFHPMEAEDATQEILIKVITNLKGFRFQGSFRGWVYRIAANHLKSVRKCLLERLGFDYEQAQEHIDRAQAKGWFSRPREAPDALLEVEMRSACTQALLITLDRDHRLAFILATVLEVPGKEGAAILGISPGAFRQRLSRARRRLVAYLSDNCGVFNGSGPCSCAALACGRGVQGWLNPHQTVFVSPDQDPGDPVRLRDYMKELDDLGKLSALFGALPHGGGPDYAARIKAILETGDYRILEEGRLH